MTVKFLNSRNKRGSEIALYLEFLVKPETNPDLTLAGNPTLSPQAQELVTPNLTNALLRIKFFSYRDRLKTDTATPLLSVISFVDVYNTSTDRSAIAIATGAQTAMWKPGQIWYMAAIQPVGGEWISTPDYSGSFILEA